MTKPKISIIVPVYNVEKYIEQSLLSLINQTLKDIEIIIVDDGCTDDSIKIVEKYAHKDKRIKIIRHKKNSGVSACRNTGIENATAEYLMFCDSDDFFATNMCEKMLDAITKDKTDIVVCGTNIIYEANKQLKKSDDDYYKVKFSGIHDVSEKIITMCDVSFWNKIFKRTIIEKHKIRCPVGLKYEDAYFFNAYMLWAKKISFLNEKLYNYRRRDGSIMNQTFQKDSSSSLQHLQIAIKFYEYLKQNKLLEQKQVFFWKKIFLPYLSLSVAWAGNLKIKKEIMQVAKTFIKENINEKLPFFILRSLNIIYSGYLPFDWKKACGGIIKIKKTPDKLKIKFLGLPIWQTDYREDKKVFYLFACIPLYKKNLGYIKNMTPLISVIVPIYNSERFLSKCLYSLTHQSLKNIEIICVDDCSTDASLKIAKEFAKKDERIKVLRTNKNSGQAVARNLGLKNSLADNIMFCDSDDFYSKNMCRKMFNAIRKDDIDMAMCGMRIKYETSHEMKRSDKKYYKIYYKGKTAVNRELFDKCDLSPCNKIFKRSILKNNDILFPEGLKYEDAYFCTVYLLCSKNIYFLKNKLYTYIRHKNSTMGQTFNTTADFAIDHLKIAIHLYEYMKKHHMYDTNRDFFWNTFLNFMNFSVLYAQNKQAVYDLANDFIKCTNEKLSDSFFDRFAYIVNRPCVSDKNAKKVGILNYFFEDENYGAILTSYALVKLITDMGYNAKNINYVASFYKVRNISDMSNFRNFRNRYIPLTKPINSLKDLKQLNKDYYAFVVGSDQVFNHGFVNKEQDVYYLGFANDNIKKISMSASFGEKHFIGSDKDKEHVKNLLSRFDALSVREKSGLDILRDMGLTGKVVLDPVFLINWSNIMGNYKHKGAFYYVINPEIQKYTNNKNSLNSSLKVEDWLAGIKTAKVFITDSFHGICFAIMFGTPFVPVVYRNGVSERVIHLLSMFGISEKHIIFHDRTDIDWAHLEKYAIKPDEKVIEKKLKMLRKQSIDFLKNALEN